MVESKVLARIARGKLCTGCGLCAGYAPDAISMAVSADGFYRPVQHKSLDGKTEQLIARSCPGLVAQPWAAIGTMDDYWGPYVRLGTSFAADEKMRFYGSSGGVLTALAAFALSSGFVDRVIHVRASTDRPLENAVTVSRTVEAVIEGAGSRYAPSSPLEILPGELAKGGRFAFIGKPCDVSALRRLALLDPRIGEHVALAMAFFCAGVPSTIAGRAVLKHLKAPPDEVKAFRYRGQGWPGDAVATLSDGSERRMSYEDSWGGYLSKDVQFRCKICPDAVGGSADIACADAWFGNDRGYPDFADRPGRSLIMSRTATGEEFFQRALAAGAVSFEVLDASQIERMQPSQARRKRLIQSRIQALRLFGRPVLDVTGTRSAEASRRAGLKEKIRSFLGMAKRVVIDGRKYARRASRPG